MCWTELLVDEALEVGLDARTMPGDGWTEGTETGAGARADTGEESAAGGVWPGGWVTAPFARLASSTTLPSSSCW